MPTLWERITGRSREEKASTNLRSAAYESLMPQAKWTPHDYGKIAKEGYQHNLWVYACIREITNAAKDTPIILIENQPNGDRVRLDTHPMLDLLRRPQPGDTHPVTWEAFLETTIAYLLISGNYYVYKQKPETRNAPPMRLYTLRPDLTKMRNDGSHEYGSGQGKRIFEPGEVLHGTLFHPLNDTYGLGVIEAASRGIDMFNAGMEHNVRLLQNGARPSSAWIAEGDLSESQFEQLRDNLRQYEGAKNAGKTLLLEGGVSWQDLSISPHEMDWLNGINNAARQIHAAFGVHPVLTGLETGTFENQDHARRGLYMGVVLPLMRQILTDMSMFLSEDYGDNLTLEVDRDGIEALAENRDALFERITKAYEVGIVTRNEAREALGYDDSAGGDAFINMPTEEAGTTPDEVKETRDVNDLHYKRFDQDLRRREERVERRLRQAHKAQRDRLMDALEQATPATIGASINRVYTLAEVREVLAEEILAAMVEEGRETVGQLKGSQPSETKELETIFGIVSQTAINEAEARAGQAVTLTTETQVAQIRSIVVAGLEQGSDIRTITAAVDELMLADIIPNRSRAIARTEIVGASNRGSYLAAEGTGLKTRTIWIATPFGDRREEHWALNGQSVNHGERFTAGLEAPMLHPHAPGSPAGEVVNCRCTHRHEVITDA